ncbi:MAG: hypothetical protein GX902_05060 [Lentisphaerae bacterium]|nr:hypothetical protein [Lentisphaerota bacterium]
MARERKKQTDDFDIFAAAATDSKRRRVAAPAAPSRAGGPSGPAMSGGPSGPAMRGGPSGPAMSGGPSGPAMRGKGATAPAKRRRRSADDKDLQALYGN